MVPNTMYRVRTRFTGVVNGPSVSTHYFLSATEDNGGVQGALDRVKGFWQALGAVIYGGLTWSTEATVDSIDYVTGRLNGSYVGTPFSSPGTATGGGEPLPPAIQGLLRYETGVIRNGKRFRGRTFVPGITEVFSGSSGTPLPAVVTAGANAMAAINGSTTYPFVIWHRPVNFAGGSIAGVTGGAIQPKFAVLRSRRD